MLWSWYAVRCQHRSAISRSSSKSNTELEQLAPANGSNHLPPLPGADVREAPILGNCGAIRLGGLARSMACKLAQVRILQRGCAMRRIEWLQR
jgi:hypothetical protein